MIPENLKIWNRTTVENFSFPVNQQSFQVHDLCKAAANACLLIHGFHLKTGKFFGNPRPRSIHHRHLICKFFTLRLQVLKNAFPVHVSTGRPVARGEERIESTTTMPMSERKQTMNPFASGSSTEYFGWTAKSTDNGTSITQILHSIIITVLEDWVF